jgi:cell division protein ZipA
MTELRWVLLALGILVIFGVYLWGRGLPQRWLSRLSGLKSSGAAKASPPRVEPEIEDEPVPPLRDDERANREPAAPVSVPETVVTLRFIPKQHEIASDRVILALRAAGLKHGRYGIFHRLASDLDDEPVFSVANLTEPGSFDLNRLAETKIRGMSFFMVLPGAGDPVERFDLMVATARSLARELDADLKDEKGSSWSIQRERYVREEIIEYRHLLDKPLPDLQR